MQEETAPALPLNPLDSVSAGILHLLRLKAIRKGLHFLRDPGQSFYSFVNAEASQKQHVEN